jgi:hypothetical protein
MNKEMNTEIQDKEAKEHAVFHGHPHGMKDPEDLKKVIKEYDEAVKYHEDKRELVRKQCDLMVKFPKPLNPEFEFETKDEWIELMRQQNKMNIGPKLQNVDADIQTTKDRRRVYQELLDTEENEVEAKERINKMILEKAEKELLGDDANGE